MGGDRDLGRQAFSVVPTPSTTCRVTRGDLPFLARDLAFGWGGAEVHHLIMKLLLLVKVFKRRQTLLLLRLWMQDVLENI